MNFNSVDSVIQDLEEFKDANFPKLKLKKSEAINEDTMKISQLNENKDEELNSAYEDCIKKFRKFKLCGHSDAVFSVSISPDKKHLVSASFDETIRLWSLLTKSTLVLYKGHFSPVLSVKFSPFS